MFDPDNPRYVSEADYYAMERDAVMAEYHRDANGYDVADYGTAEDPEDPIDYTEEDDDLQILNELRQIEHYNWTDEMVIGGRTATIAVARLKRADTTLAPAYATAISYKAWHLNFILEGGEFPSGVTVFVPINELDINVIEFETEDILRIGTAPTALRNLYTPADIMQFVKFMLPGLVFTLERDVKESNVRLAK